MGVRTGAIAGLLLLLACANETIPVRSGRLEYTGCDDGERHAIARAFDRAARLAEIAETAIDDPEKRALAGVGHWPQYTWWFGAYSDERYEIVRDVLAATRSEFGRAYEMRCASNSRDCPPEEPPSESRGRLADIDEYGPEFEQDWGPEHAWDVFAYANSGIRSLQICADFFAEDRNERAAILFHEMTHVARDTDDYSYRERDILDLATQRPGRAVRNAPSYQGFATSVDSGRLPRDDSEADDDD